MLTESSQSLDASGGFGKHYSSMYTGSMIGKGAMVFALMGYVIAEQKPCLDGVFRVELNPVLLACIFGEDEPLVCRAIEFLCAPDERSRSKQEVGRRLVREGEFLYRVVNGAKYRAMRSAARRREQNLEAQRVHRDKKRKPSGGSLRERLAANGEAPMPGDVAPGKDTNGIPS